MKARMLRITVVALDATFTAFAQGETSNAIGDPFGSEMRLSQIQITPVLPNLIKGTLFE